MILSARMLGERFGLTGQEMNYALKEAGFLSGNPGDYTITEKAKAFVVENDFHRGNGGYSMYNRYWTTRKWDEKIVDELNLDTNHISALRNAVASDRRLKKEVDLAAQKMVISNVSIDITKESVESSKAETKKILIIGGIVVAATVTGYVIYKTIPHVKRWCKTKFNHEEEEKNGKKKKQSRFS
ncbi:hypothetical protein [Parasporobacterium paucivorans]|uniref:Uncharacterized protein n=1 Tax=Parasporobacterium paucivorans DSM 15970 TaxID=1122934 RepID=A0A1M6LSH0_9FIRM|nr:hypothetical protein [Parasporobacterium paucivorans]SHJ74174.1 hypothetical protein SAMN02745691_02445 [Parasporobacterium paucivorans DSM 15970]